MPRAVRAVLALPAVPALALLAACGPSKEAATPEAPASAAASGADPVAPAATPATWPSMRASSGETPDARAERLRRDPGPHTSNWTPPGKSARYGRAEGLVAAPPAAVVAKLGDYFHYRDLAGPKFKTVRVVDKQATTADVYFQLPIMRGAIVLFYTARFSPPRATADRCQIVEGTFVKGNVEDVHLVLEACEIDPQTTAMGCDLHVGIRVPAPQSAIDEELRDACADAIKALRESLKPKAPPP